jgi:hypothetical protein
VPFQWIELTSDEHARALAQVTGLNACRQITEKLGWFRNPSRSES